jgi:glycosyltransferase involved in cell wall biosynthesis
MKILHLSTHDAIGGAAKAATRLHGAQKNHPEVHHSRLLVSDKSGSDPHTIGLDKALTFSLRRNLERLPLKLDRHQNASYASLAWLPNPKLMKAVHAYDPDIIHLHWTQNAFLPLQSLPKLAPPNIPLVWSFHDTWPFSGKFHNEYVKARPTPESHTPRDHSVLNLDSWVRRRKNKAYCRLENQGRPFSAVSPSHWLADKALQSELWKNRPLKVIPNGIDTDLFKPTNPLAARTLLNLPQDKLIICFGAMFAGQDENKGYRELVSALNQLRFNNTDLHLAVFGMNEPTGPDAPTFPFPTTYFGILKDEISLAALYAATDVMVTPSRQESFGLVPAEAMACGTPVVAFNASATKEVVRHEETGFLAEPFEPASLARGIEWILEDPERIQHLGTQARAHVMKNFCLKQVAGLHVDLYHDLLGSTPASTPARASDHAH